MLGMKPADISGIKRGNAWRTKLMSLLTYSKKKNI
jgi:hypothetical protein